MAERILLIGSGGREHALAKALAASHSCSALWAAPGNPGIAREAQCVALDTSNHSAVARWCRDHAVTLVVIGPEQPLAEGLSDDLREEGFDVFGPSQAAAQIESSKGFSKDLMHRLGIPTAPYRRFAANERDNAVTYAANHSVPVVVKYDGLAAGKGVVIAESNEDAVSAVNEMFNGVFGDDGVVIEGYLAGHEASVFAICDGTDYITLAPAQDHKRIGDGDTGKNTGGMGAYAPAPIVTDDVLATVKTDIIEPLLRGMADDGMPFVGCLFCGLMIDDGEPYVVEFNARFGDPETQVVLSLLDADVAALFASAARGMLDTSVVRSVAVGAACTVVLASGGYPDAYQKGAVITGVNEAEADPHVNVYHAGTRDVDGTLVTSGGRVLGVTAHDDTLKGAVHRAYEACAKVAFDGMVFRTDIASKAFNA